MQKTVAYKVEDPNFKFRFFGADEVLMFSYVMLLYSKVSYMTRLVGGCLVPTFRGGGGGLDFSFFTVD